MASTPNILFNSKTIITTMGKLYFYRSSNFNISSITIFSSNPIRAYNLALKYFKRNKIKGIPIRIAI